MATNTGIEVTALRPAAQAGDFYVRPDQTPSGIEQGLARLAGTMSAKKKIEDKATAENLYLTDSLDSANDIHNMDAYAHTSLAVQSHLKEMRGRTAGYAYMRESEQAYNEWRMNSSETGEDFPAFMAERKSKFAQTLGDDRFLISGAMGAINQSEQNLNAIHNSFLHTRMREETKTSVLSNVDVYVEQMGKGLRIEDVVTQIEDSVMTAHNTGGMTKAEGNKAVFEHVVKMYRDTGNDNFRLLARNLRYAVGTGTTLNSTAEQAINDAIEHVQYEEDKEQASQDQAEEKALVQLRKDTWEGVNANFVLDNNYNMTMKETQALLDAGVNINQIKAVRDGWAGFKDVLRNDDHIIRAAEIRAEIQANMFNPDGIPISQEALLAEMATGGLHPKDLQSLFSDLKTAENATPLLQGPTARGFRTTLLKEVEGGFYGIQSPENAEALASVTRAFDEKFVSLIQLHYADPAQGTPTEMQVMEYAKQAQEAVKNKTEQVTAERAEVNLQAKNIKKALDFSESGKGVTGLFDAKPKFIANFLTTETGQALDALVQADPFQLIPYKEEGYTDQFGTMEDKVTMLPAHEVLEKVIQGMEGGGNGGYYEYDQYKKLTQGK